MKKFITLLLVCLMFFPSTALLEMDYSGMSTEELYVLRQDINNELGDRIYPLRITDGMTIAEIFPDKVFAKLIRDMIGAFSINDTVTQEQLDTIKKVNFLSRNDGLSSLDGILYLRNLQELYLYYQSDLKEIPNEIGTLQALKAISFERCGISELPDSICDLVNLERLNISNTQIKSLPSDIGNLSHLKELDISNTLIKELPQSIYSLTLDKFYRKGLDIE